MKNSRITQKITDVPLADLSKYRWKVGERSRTCPKCGTTIEYKDKWSYIYGCQNNRRCKPCVCKDNAIENDYKTKFLGKNNPFYGKTHTDANRRASSERMTLAMSGEDNPMKRRECKEHFSKLFSGKGNPMFGKIVSNETRAKLSIASAGKNNPMFGKPSPAGSGNGWANWYKGRHFRSLRELQYFITEVEGRGLSCESAQRYRIPYKSYDGIDRTYQPDFLVGNVLIEIKPKKIMGNSVGETEKRSRRTVLYKK